MEAVWKCMLEDDPTLVNKSKLTVDKMMSKWFSMKKVVQDYHDRQSQTGGAYEDPPPYYEEMNDCFEWLHLIQRVFSLG